MAIRSELRHTLSWCLKQDDFTAPEAAEALSLCAKSVRRQFAYFVAHGVMEGTLNKRAGGGVVYIYRITDMDKAIQMATTMPKPRNSSVFGTRKAKPVITTAVNSVFALGSL